jgi:hypothetical protein
MFPARPLYPSPLGVTHSALPSRGDFSEHRYPGPRSLLYRYKPACGALKKERALKELREGELPRM